MQEWLEFLDSAGEDGVVLFSMGSYATGIDEDVAALFAGAFAQIPQKVIWKLNGKPSATLTPNVKVVDWIPQNDLLGKLGIVILPKSKRDSRNNCEKSNFDPHEINVACYLHHLSRREEDLVEFSNRHENVPSPLVRYSEHLN